MNQMGRGSRRRTIGQREAPDPGTHLLIHERLNREKAALHLRPEAQRMTWQELCQPERKAIRALLLRMFQGLDDLDATGRRGAGRHDDEPRFTNGFLIYGNRGTGKTTVLLNAARATEDPRTFFGGEHRQRDDRKVESSPAERRDEEKRQELHDEATGHSHRLVWLDVLDMEFLPDHANLLTTLLVRVRDALDHALSDRLVDNDTDGGDHQQRSDSARSRRIGTPPPHLLQAGHEVLEVWEELDELIKDGTPMWEGIEQTGEARKRVEPQIRAAETYAGIQRRLDDAFEQAARRLARRRGVPDDVVLVLPIDNADRSPDHVFDVLKLIRMVSSPKIWFVVAASQQDLDNYLEASFQKKLKNGTGDDGTLVGAARRHAAALHREVLPPAHRIEVACMQAEEALGFELPMKLSARDPGPKTLKDALGQFQTGLTMRSPLAAQGAEVGWQVAFEVPNGLVWVGSDVEEKPPLTLLDLILLVDGEHVNGERFISRAAHEPLREAEGRRVEETTGPEGDAPLLLFSDAGRRALTVSMRRLLDLKQAAMRWRVQDLRSEEDWTGPEERSPRETERTIELVNEMLHGAIAESDLSDWACRLLTETILYRNVDELVCLDLRDRHVQFDVRCRERHLIDIDLPPPNKMRWLSSRVVLNDYYGFVLSLHADGKDQTLCRDVSGWFMLLYDLLQGSQAPRVLFEPGTSSFEKSPTLVETVHTLALPVPGEPDADRLLSVRMPWTMPPFEGFIDFDIFARLWKAMSHELFSPPPGDGSTPATPARQIGSIPELLRLMMTAWVDCALTTIARDDPIGLPGDWRDRYWALFSDDSLVQRLFPGRRASAAPGQAEAATDWKTTFDDYANAVYGQALRALHSRTRVDRPEAPGDRPGEDLSRQWTNLRTWLELGTLLLAQPEYLGSVPPPAGAPGWGEAQLAHVLERNERWLKAKRREYLRRAVETALRTADEGHGSAMPVGPPRKRDVSNACNTWFEATRPSSDAAAAQK